MAGRSYGEKSEEIKLYNSISGKTFITDLKMNPFVFKIGK